MVTRERFVIGAVQALRDAVVGGSEVVEGVHSAVLGTVVSTAPVLPVLPVVPLVTRGVYRSIREITALAGGGAEWALRLINSLAPEDSAWDSMVAPWQLHLLSAFNAAFGDHFEAQGSAWAIPMSLCQNGVFLPMEAPALAAQLQDPKPQVVILLHGMGMNDLQWRDAEGNDLGAYLDERLSCTRLHLRYNSGRHISENGESLARLLEDLVSAYPIPIERLTLIGHSMGGLLARSAGYYAQQLQLSWIDVLQDVVCLGSPHRGAPLENLGNWFAALLTLTPYTFPLSRLGKRRSAGIKDLRHGSLRHEDWLGRDNDQLEHMRPKPVPLLPQVRYLLLASSLGNKSDSILGKGIGDGLVAARSALNPRTGNAADLESPWIRREFIAKLSHLGMLYDARVHTAVADWLLEPVSSCS